MITSDLKKPGQTAVLYHYCGLSRFFFESDVSLNNFKTKGLEMCIFRLVTNYTLKPHILAQYLKGKLINIPDF